MLISVQLSYSRLEAGFKQTVLWKDVLTPSPGRNDNDSTEASVIHQDTTNAACIQYISRFYSSHVAIPSISACHLKRKGSRKEAFGRYNGFEPTALEQCIVKLADIVGDKPRRRQPPASAS
jgi:hypothetical protein